MLSKLTSCCDRETYRWAEVDPSAAGGAGEQGQDDEDAHDKADALRRKHLRTPWLSCWRRLPLLGLIHRHRRPGVVVLARLRCIIVWARRRQWRHQRGRLLVVALTCRRWSLHLWIKYTGRERSKPDTEKSSFLLDWHIYSYKKLGHRVLASAVADV